MDTEPIFLCVFYDDDDGDGTDDDDELLGEHSKKGKFRSRVFTFSSNSDCSACNIESNWLYFCQRTGNRFYVRYLDTHTHTHWAVSSQLSGTIAFVCESWSVRRLLCAGVFAMHMDSVQIYEDRHRRSALTPLSPIDGQQRFCISVEEYRVAHEYMILLPSILGSHHAVILTFCNECGACFSYYFDILGIWWASNLHKSTQFTSSKCSSQTLLSTSRQTDLEHVYLAYRSNIYQQQHSQLLRLAAPTDIFFYFFVRSLSHHM